ncbi:flagellar basal body protein [Sphingosinicella terrae]|uniref:flagellar basal body protein n=1 Tax=Sphingosinicella terrae TaxID=2172047 RepID=UPI000E0D6F4E|nr:flagellar basal body protein [Sphingosinicella terrae]
MSGSNINLLQGLNQAMRHLSDRQRVIAQNIANSETPGYRSRDLSAPDFSSLVAAQGQAGAPRVERPRVTLTSGMTAMGATAGNASRLIEDSDVSETKPDGNNVTLEDQLLRMGQVQADFATLTGLYRKQMGLLRGAIGRGG